MLNFMRRHAQSWIIKAIFVVIILVFIFWGVGSFRARHEVVVAKVNGEPIYYKDYINLFRQVIESYRARFKDFNEDWIKRLNLRQTVLDQLIERRLLLQEAKKMGLTVSETEVWERIASYRVFQRNGKFDPKLYESVLARYHYTPAQFEAAIREDIAISKLRHLIENLAHVSEKELYETYAWIKQKINLRFLELAPNKFSKEIKPNEEAIKKYFLAHKEEYVIPKQLKLAYLNINYVDFLDQIQPTEKEIKDYYEASKDQYFEPKKVCARHILFRVSPDASKDEVEKIKKKAERVLEQIKKGANFAKLAKKYSDDKATAVKGGDLGCFSEGVMVKPFEQTAFALKKGEVSNLVKTRFGFHIIQVYDIKEARTKPLNEVKDKIVQKIKQEKAKEQALIMANRIYAEAILEKSLKKAATKYQKEIKETGYFSVNNWPSILPSKLKEEIINLKKEEITAPLEGSKGYIIVQVLDQKPQRMPNFAEIKDKAKEDWIKEEAKKVAKKVAEDILSKLQKGEDIKKLLAKYNLKEEETGFFSQGWIPKVGFNFKVEKDLFSLTSKNPILNYVAEINGKFYIFILKDRQEVKMADYEKEKDEFKQKLLAQRKAIAFQTWVKELRKKAKIEVKKELIQ
jgi:peptidyl-prolyl cis-trans isomerase D